jgi:hypothetical protein
MNILNRALFKKYVRLIQEENRLPSSRSALSLFDGLCRGAELTKNYGT